MKASAKTPKDIKRKRKAKQNKRYVQADLGSSTATQKSCREPGSVAETNEVAKANMTKAERST